MFLRASLSSTTPAAPRPAGLRPVLRPLLWLPLMAVGLLGAAWLPPVLTGALVVVTPVTVLTIVLARLLSVETISAGSTPGAVVGADRRGVHGVLHGYRPAVHVRDRAAFGR
jgi:hypothetical protein